jgi:hypothetical protein
MRNLVPINSLPAQEALATLQGTHPDATYKTPFHGQTFAQRHNYAASPMSTMKFAESVRTRLHEAST